MEKQIESLKKQNKLAWAKYFAERKANAELLFDFAENIKLLKNETKINKLKEKLKRLKESINPWEEPCFMCKKKDTKNLVIVRCGVFCHIQCIIDRKESQLKCVCGDYIFPVVCVETGNAVSFEENIQEITIDKDGDAPISIESKPLDGTPKPLHKKDGSIHIPKKRTTKKD